MEYLFQSNFYIKFKAPNSENFIDALNNHCGKNTKFDWSELCDIKTFQLKSHDYIKYLAPSLDILSDKIEYHSGYNVNHPWLNYYKKNGFQEVHDHYPSDIVCVFFLNSGEDFSKFYFLDRSSLNLSPKLRKNLKFYNNKFVVETEPGDIIFFPGHMLHGVTLHKSDIIRKTFSVNIDLLNYEK